MGIEKITPKGYVLGVRIDALDMQGVYLTLKEWIRNRKPHYVCCVPAHSVMDCVNHPELRQVFNHSGLSTPDGMAIVWLLKLRGFPEAKRVYGPDVLINACRRGIEPGWRHYFYGGKPEVCRKLVIELQKRFRGIQIAGAESPPFRELTGDERAAFVDRIRQAKPDILWVALGSPKQEQWMAEWVGILDVPVLVGVGAAFDFITSTKPQAPRWIQGIGMEWFFRLASEPGRLWKRYVLNYPRFVFLILLETLGIRRYGE